MCDSLDSALVERAMARLALELGSEFVYNVIITDYETGLEHEVKVSLLSMHLIYFEIDFYWGKFCF